MAYRKKNETSTFSSNIPRSILPAQRVVVGDRMRQIEIIQPRAVIAPRHDGGAGDDDHLPAPPATTSPHTCG